MENFSFIESLKTICNINTKSKINGAFNVEGINKCLNIYSRYFSDRLFEIRRFEVKNAADLLLIKCKTNKFGYPRILLSGHIDTVLSPDEVTWNIDDQKVYGSGVSDMKGGLIVIKELIHELLKKGLLFNIDIVVSPEEEVALPNHRSNLENIAKEYDYIFVYEATLDGIDDSDKDTRGVVVSRRGYQLYELRITTPGGHSGTNITKDSRVSANLILAEFILRLESLADYDKKITFNSGIIQGGKAVNAISPEAFVIFENRFSTSNDHIKSFSEIENLLNELRKKYPKSQLTLSKQEHFPSMDVRSKTINFIDAFQSFYKYNIVKEFRNGGGESSIFSTSNSDAVILDGLGVKGGFEHSVDEFAYVYSFEHAVKFSFDLVDFVFKNFS